jgi:hypothetical protein
MDSRQISNCGFLFEQSYILVKNASYSILRGSIIVVLAVGQIFIFAACAGFIAFGGEKSGEGGHPRVGR